jgi:hypothetical protein
MWARGCAKTSHSRTKNKIITNVFYQAMVRSALAREETQQIEIKELLL